MAVQMTPEQIEAVERWAEHVPWITEAWLFGSRAKGTARSDSDFDIAVTIKGGARTGNTSAETLWHFNHEEWEAAISSGLQSHVSFYPKDETTKDLVTEAVLIWSRSPPSRQS